MKKIIALILAMSFLFSFSVGASAATMESVGTKKLVNHPYLRSIALTSGYEDLINQGYNVLGVFPTSKLAEGGKQFLRDWFSALMGVDETHFVYLTSSKSGTDAYLSFIMVDRSKFIGFTKSSFDNSYVLNASGGVKSIVFNVTTKQWHSLAPTTSDQSSFVPTNTNMFLLWGDQVFDYFVSSGGLGAMHADYFAYLPNGGGIAFVDDDGLLSPKEPDPDPEPSQPPPVTPEFPTIGDTDNQYIPYKTSHWNSFLLSVRTAIGNSTNIGLIILGMIFSILLIIRIVKWFARV